MGGFLCWGAAWAVPCLHATAHALPRFMGAPPARQRHTHDPAAPAQVGEPAGRLGAMALVLFLAFLVIPVIELYVVVQVAGSLGIVPTLALLVAVSIAGSLLVKYQGLGLLARVRQQLSAGQVPTADILDGVMVLFAGALLLTPGFITDVVGLALLVPPVRAGVRAVAAGTLARRIAVATPAGAAGAAAWGAASRYGTGRQGRVRVGDAVIVTDARSGDTTGPDNAAPGNEANGAVELPPGPVDPTGDRSGGP